MKAKHVKQHVEDIDYEEEEDKWGDKIWLVEGKKYHTRQAAMKAVDELIAEEFRQRYLKEKKK